MKIRKYVCQTCKREYQQEGPGGLRRYCEICRPRSSKPKLRTFVCTRCHQTKIQSSFGGRLKEVCEDCKSEKRLCACGCGGYVQANWNDSQYISGHNARVLSKETRLKISEGGKRARQKFPEKYVQTEEIKQKISETVKQLHRDGVYFNSYGQLYSNWELRTLPYLSPLGYVHSTEKKYHIPGKSYGEMESRVRIPDFVNSEKRHVVELFGIYWHRDQILPDDQKHVTPEELIEWYREAGWECVVIWEDQEEEFIIFLQLLSLITALTCLER
jgi:hypothetical protein